MNKKNVETFITCVVWCAVDMSETERHLYDANSRYDQLGAVLSDRLAAVQSTERDVTQYTDRLDSLSAWLDDKEQIVLPLKSLSANEREAADKLKEHQVSVLVNRSTNTFFYLSTYNNNNDTMGQREVDGMGRYSSRYFR